MTIKMKRSLGILFAIILGICAINPVTSYANENNGTPSVRATDVYTKSPSSTSSYTRSMVSITPSSAAVNAPSYVKKVSFSVTITGYMHYNRATGQYVSASSPSVSVNYSGRVSLSLTSCSTYYRDNGNSVTFSYSGRLKGSITSDTGVICHMDYGTVSGSYTVQK